MTSFSTMSLYSLTVKPSSATQDAVVGDFVGNGKQQVLIASGSRLSIIQIVRGQKGSREIFSQDLFGILRRIAKFRLAGGKKDFIAITTDSGRLVTYEYQENPSRLEQLHFETFGKSGIRRVIPGEYLAADPKGRAFMLASTEKNKLVYILTRSGNTKIAISSPLEAHKPQTIVFDLIALDVGYDNPMFAALELDFSTAEVDPTGEALQELKKELVYYELDLGLNHIVRKWSEPVDRTAHKLFRVPGGPNAASGVLCCGVDNITYRRIFNSKAQIHRLAIPRREGPTEDPNRKRSIVAGTLYTLKGGEFFYLLQTEDGDLFKVTLDVRDAEVVKMKIKFFDTVPVATSICIMRSGFVYVGTESGDNQLYHFEALGDDTADNVFASTQFPTDPLANFNPPFFRPRPLENLSLLEEHVESVSSLSPLIGMEVSNPALEDSPQIYTINGAGPRSTFRTTRNALNVFDLVDSPLPQEASSVWTTKLNYYDPADTLIVLSLISGTQVLKMGDDVEEASTTGFIQDTNTLGVQQFGDDSILQIHPKGIRQIVGLAFDEGQTAAHFEKTEDWDAPPHRTVVACASNNRQIALALSSGQLLYFELDVDGGMTEAPTNIFLDATITCLAIPEVPEGQIRAFFLAVGCSDHTVRVFNLTPDMDGEILRSISVQGVSAAPTDLAINTMRDKSAHGESQYLHIGLRSGVYIRSGLNESTGEIEGTRRRFLGPEPITFATVTAVGQPAVLAMTSRPWLVYSHPRTSALELTPLDYMRFNYAWNFVGAAFSGIICVSARQLRIFTLRHLAQSITHKSIPLRYTPKQFVGYHEQGIFYVVESEPNTMSAATRQRLINESSQGDDDDAMDIDDDTTVNGTGGAKVAVNGTNGATHDEATVNGDQVQADGNDLPPTQFGYPKAAGHNASCIQVVDPLTDNAVLQTIELDDNKSAISVTLCPFDFSGETVWYLSVGVVKDLRFLPAGDGGSFIQLYKVSPNGREVEFLHETEMPYPPVALLPYKGKLAVGMGKDLVFYECGNRALLRKAMAIDCVPTRITALKKQGSRIIVSDAQQSVVYVVHKDQPTPQRLIPFIDDQVPRHTTSMETLDYNTTVGGDKFGSLWVVRCPTRASEAADESPDGLNLLQERSYLAGAPNRLELIAQFFVNDIPTAIQQTSLISGGDEVIFWAGLQGTLGALVPLTSRRQHKMFQQLELLMRNEDEPLSGRSHLGYRSYYAPVKSVIDGDLIERFLVLSRDQREGMVGQLNGTWTSEQVDEAIWNMRALYAF